MTIISIKTAPSIAFMIITGHTIKNNEFTEVNLESLPSSDVLSLNYAINNLQLIGQSGSDKTAINNAAAAIRNCKDGSGSVGDYDLPIASESALGGIKIGDNLSIEEDGTLSAEAGNSAAIEWDMSEQSIPAKPKKTEGLVGTAIGDAYDHVGFAYPLNSSKIRYGSFGEISSQELFYVKSNGPNSVFQCNMNIAGCELRFNNNSIQVAGYGENQPIVVDDAFTAGSVARFAFDMDEEILYIATTNGADIAVDVGTYQTSDPYEAMFMYTSNVGSGGELHLRFSSVDDYGSGLGIAGYSPVSEIGITLPAESKDGSILYTNGGTYENMDYTEKDGAIIINKENGTVISFGATQGYVEQKAQEIVDQAIDGLPTYLMDAPTDGQKYTRQTGLWTTITDPIYPQELVVNVDETTTEIWLGNNGDAYSVIIDGTEDHAGFDIEPYQMPAGIDVLFYPKINVAAVNFKSGYTVAGGTLTSFTAGEYRVVRRLDNLGLILIIK